MFITGPDQNGLMIRIAVRHIVALVPHEDMAGPVTQVITTGSIGDDVQSYFLALHIDEVESRCLTASRSH